MHELSLCESTLELIVNHAKTHKANRITALWLEIGALSCIEEHAIRFSFELVCKGTIAEQCQLHITHKPARAWCWDCSKEVQVCSHLDGCPVCTNHNLRIDSGDNLVIKELEVE